MCSSINSQSRWTDETSCANRDSLFTGLFYSFRNSINTVTTGNSENVHRSSPGSIKQLFNRKFSNLDAGKYGNSNSYDNINNNHIASTIQRARNEFHRKLLSVEVFCQPQKNILVFVLKSDFSCCFKRWNTLYFMFIEYIKHTLCSSYAPGISLTLSAVGELVFKGGKNYSSRTSLQEKLSSRLAMRWAKPSSQPLNLAAAWPFNETLVCPIKKNYLSTSSPFLFSFSDKRKAETATSADVSFTLTLNLCLFYLRCLKSSLPSIAYRVRRYLNHGKSRRKLLK